MSIASKLNTLLNIRDRLRHLLGNRWGKSEALGEGLDGCTTLLEDVNVISEGMYFVPTTMQQRIAPADSYVVEDLYLAGDPDLVSGNIKEGVEIFGVTGTYSGGGNVQTVKSVMPDFSDIRDSYPVTPDFPYTSMARVAVERDPRLESSNIKSGQTIYGIVGTYGGGSSSIEPEKIGNLDFGSASATQYVSVFPDNGYDAMARVRINRPSDLESSNIISGKTIFGVTGTYQPGATSVGGTASSATLQFSFKEHFTIIPYADIYMIPTSPTSIDMGNFKILKLTLRNLNCSNGSYSYIDALTVSVSKSSGSNYYYYIGSNNVRVSVSTFYDGANTTFRFIADSMYSREFVSGASYSMVIVS